MLRVVKRPSRSVGREHSFGKAFDTLFLAKLNFKEFEIEFLRKHEINYGTKLVDKCRTANGIFPKLCVDESPEVSLLFDVTGHAHNNAKVGLQSLPKKEFCRRWGSG